MPTIKVNLAVAKDRSYSIEVESGMLARIPVLLGKNTRITRWVIITDSRVKELYGSKLLKSLRNAKLQADLIAFPAGERSKNRRTIERIQDKMFDLGLGRDGGIIALGGGVTGDMAGFIAATYMRGIPFIQIPTTLLAMVDSSIGGKTGIDAPAGKNLIGAFNQPLAVFIDLELLMTLPAKELCSGMAEVVKHAVIADAELFDLIEKNAEAILKRDLKLLSKIVARNCAIKARVVEADERESGARKILNYGHTIGHAVEKVSKYSILHGAAVAIGMAVEGAISNKLGLMPAEDLKRQNALLKRFGFRIGVPNKFRPDDITKAMMSDKKVRAGAIRMALPARIGAISGVENGLWTVAPPMKTVRRVMADATLKA